MASIQFYGDNSTADISQIHLLPFSTEVKITSKRELLQIAIQDARKEYEGQKNTELNKLRALRIEFEKATNKNYSKNLPIL